MYIFIPQFKIAIYFLLKEESLFMHVNYIFFDILKAILSSMLLVSRCKCTWEDCEFCRSFPPLQNATSKIFIYVYWLLEWFQTKDRDKKLILLCIHFTNHKVYIFCHFCDRIKMGKRKPPEMHNKIIYSH